MCAEVTIENTVSVFNLDSDDIKGQIIGNAIGYKDQPLGASRKTGGEWGEELGIQLMRFLAKLAVHLRQLGRGWGRSDEAA